MATGIGPDRLGVALAGFREDPDGVHGVYVMPPDAAIFRDHFPGDPLLPAIGILDLCRHLLGRWQGPDARLAGLRRLRLSQAVRPPARLEIGLRGAGGRVSMTACSPAAEHAAGDLLWAPAGSIPGAGTPGERDGAVPASGREPGAQAVGPARAAGEPDRLPDPSCLPHGPGMRLVESVDSCSEDRMLCRCRIPPGFPWGRESVLPPHLALEGVAQAAGVLAAAAMATGSEPGPRRGYITRVREAAFPGPGLDPGLPWKVEVALLGRSGGLVLCRGRARQRGQEILSARLGLYLEDSGQSR